jgi:Mn2+/Fe2+ NRAMP family transporter
MYFASGCRRSVVWERLPLLALFIAAKTCNQLVLLSQVCDALGVPLVVVPLTDEYWQRVVSHSVAEIKAH